MSQSNNSDFDLKFLDGSFFFIPKDSPRLLQNHSLLIASRLIRAFSSLIYLQQLIFFSSGTKLFTAWSTMRLNCSWKWTRSCSTTARRSTRSSRRRSERRTGRGSRPGKSSRTWPGTIRTLITWATFLRAWWPLWWELVLDLKISPSGSVLLAA